MTFVPTIPRRADALVEYATYTDDGCEVAPRCLECPLAVCRYDERPETSPRQENHIRIKAEAYLRVGLTASAVAVIVGVSRRTVFRYQAGR